MIQMMHLSLVLDCLQRCKCYFLLFGQLLHCNSYHPQWIWHVCLSTCCKITGPTFWQFSGCCWILTRIIVLTVTHHETEPGWTRTTTCRTDVLTNTEGKRVWTAKQQLCKVSGSSCLLHRTIIKAILTIILNNIIIFYLFIWYWEHERKTGNMGKEREKPVLTKVAITLICLGVLDQWFSVARLIRCDLQHNFNDNNAHKAVYNLNKYTNQSNYIILWQARTVNCLTSTILLLNCGFVHLRTRADLCGGSGSYVFYVCLFLWAVSTQYFVDMFLCLTSVTVGMWVAT